MSSQYHSLGMAGVETSIQGQRAEGRQGPDSPGLVVHLKDGAILTGASKKIKLRADRQFMPLNV